MVFTREEDAEEAVSAHVTERALAGEDTVIEFEHGIAWCMDMAGATTLEVRYAPFEEVGRLRN
jgi:hypothetical protein